MRLTSSEIGVVCVSTQRKWQYSLPATENSTAYWFKPTFVDVKSPTGTPITRDTCLSITSRATGNCGLFSAARCLSQLCGDDGNRSAVNKPRFTNITHFCCTSIPIQTGKRHNVLHLSVRLFVHYCRVMLCKRGLSRHAVSVRPSVCHVRTFCHNEYSYPQILFTVGYSQTTLVLLTRLCDDTPTSTPWGGRRM